MTQRSWPETKAICLPSGVNATRSALLRERRSMGLTTPSPAAKSSIGEPSPVLRSMAWRSKRRRTRSLPPLRASVGNATPSSDPSAAPTSVTRVVSPPESGMEYTSNVPSASLLKYTVWPSADHMGSMEATFWKRSRSESRRVSVTGSVLRSASQSCMACGPWYPLRFQFERPRQKSTLVWSGLMAASRTPASKSMRLGVLPVTSTRNARPASE